MTRSRGNSTRRSIHSRRNFNGPPLFHVERLESRQLLSAVVRAAIGADAGAIQPLVDLFRSDLGPLNANVAGSFSAGHREISWDDVPDAFAAPNNLPGNFFNSLSHAGIVLATPGSGFQVSARPGNPTATPGEFDNISAGYSSSFQAFSSPRLFTALGSTVTDVSFFVAGTTTPATVHGFGAVFTDVDNGTLPNSTRFECFDQAGTSLGVFTAPVVNNGLSFIGVAFNAGERIGRVRITSGNTPLGAGVADNNGTSDLVVMDDFIFGEPRGNDMGDAPDTYSTLISSNGARHVANSGLYLGTTVDVDVDGQPGSTALGDDTTGVDDEDGVTFGPLLQGSVATITVTASANGRLDAFVDFNADGDFADAGEKIFSSTVVQAGTNSLQFAVPSNSASGATFARFRVSSAGGLSYSGQAADGEVEDYKVTLTAPAPASLSGWVYRDLNNNGLFEPVLGDTGIGGVIVTLSGQTDQGNSLNVAIATDVTGAFTFTGLRPAGPGGYTITESQPAGIADGLDALGSAGGSLSNDLVSGIVFSAGTNATGYLFGERPARLTGFVYRDNNGSGAFEPGLGETGLVGVAITLGGSAVGSTTTAADGSYSFINLLAGTYSVAETQPAQFIDGLDIAGSSGGTPGQDNVTSITLAAGATATGYNFGERVGISIGDASVAEGAAGTVNATFTVSLSVANNQPVTVDVATADGTATSAGSDYFPLSTSVTFAPNETSKTVAVAVRGDLTAEPDETFVVNLSNAQGAAVVDSQGVAAIHNDDPPVLARMYRAFNPNANYHFFTTSRVQFDNAVAAGYRDETTGRAGFSVLASQPTGSVPVYRLYNFQTGHHYYTLNAAERASLINIVPPTSPAYGTAGWRDEGVEGAMFPSEEPTTTRIYRLYNTTTGTHLFTENAATRNAILAQFPGVWIEHSALGYAFAVPAGATAVAAAVTAPAQSASVLPLAVSPSGTSSSGSSNQEPAATRLDSLLAFSVDSPSVVPSTNAVSEDTIGASPGPLTATVANSDSKRFVSPDLIDAVFALAENL